MKKLFLVLALMATVQPAFCWGFFGHQKINYLAVFLLPPSMLVFFKPHIDFLSEHATDPDKRRYALPAEGPRHYIDLDKFPQPWDSIPRQWTAAVEKYSEDSLQRHGIVPWWIQFMYIRLVKAFREKQAAAILKLSAEIGHYLADAHVPLHACSNHNGQYTGQRGIHGFWESRIPELLAEREWDFFLGPADYISHTAAYAWQVVKESAAASDTVLRYEKLLTAQFPPDRKYAFELRNGVLVRQYSTDFSLAYDRMLGGMVERRMRASVHAVASFWYSAWVDAGQPDLSPLSDKVFSEKDQKEFESLEQSWKNNSLYGREEE